MTDQQKRSGSGSLDSNFHLCLTTLKPVARRLNSLKSLLDILQVEPTRCRPHLLRQMRANAHCITNDLLVHSCLQGLIVKPCSLRNPSGGQYNVESLATSTSGLNHSGLPLGKRRSRASDFAHPVISSVSTLWSQYAQQSASVGDHISECIHPEARSIDSGLFV
ncbi:uncharacterized protein CC84DRAFT_275813 [Paraphaeosphaeria sporulosa]|uniref:Uncharacterized protein n=1 Tax=Paraphaeosphaeria sporulosa TaxID=1460663 RepID=A0A177C2B1_9PLEO|nr:uncharacterized protein CC84DRAFT_275813 [Paraphaeosphaeria sporulosa]OAG01029.1 hypothetical protein CC84DRAFT_275813 [Paraphaeosphaeria sporulosa]